MTKETAKKWIDRLDLVHSISVIVVGVCYIGQYLISKRKEEN